MQTTRIEVNSFDELLTLFFDRDIPEHEWEIITLAIGGTNEPYRLNLLKRIESIFTSKGETEIIRVHNDTEKEVFSKERISENKAYLCVLNDYRKDQCSTPFLLSPAFYPYRSFHGIRHTLNRIKPNGLIYFLLNMQKPQALDPRTRANLSLVINTELDFDIISIRTLHEYLFFTKKIENPTLISPTYFKMFIENLLHQVINIRTSELGITMSNKFEKSIEILNFCKTPEISNFINNSLKLKRLYKKINE